MALEGFLIVLGFVLGGVCGSFFNVLIYRLPLGQSIVMPPSHCMKCGEPIHWYDNIPLISYIALGGRCRACKAPYSFRYFIVELLTALLFALVVARYVEITTQESVLKGVGLTLVHFFFVGGMIICAFTDLDHHIIPNELTYPGIPLGLVASFFFPSMMGLEDSAHWRSLLYSFVSAVGAGGSLFLVGELVKRALKPYVIVSPAAGEFVSRSLPDSLSGVHVGQLVDVTDIVGVIRSQEKEKEIPADFFGTITKVLVKSGQRVEAGQALLCIKKEALGLGDVKILAVIGAFLGWKLAILTVLLSSVVGLLAHVLLVVVARKSEWHAEIPFGVYIVPASIISYFWGSGLIHWYISLVVR